MIPNSNDGSREPRTNSLLTALPASVRNSLRQFCHDRTLQGGQVLWEPGEQPDRLYFPIRGAVSLAIMTRSGKQLEVGSIGHESGAGLHEAFGNAVTRGIVQATGTFTVVSVRDFRTLMPQIHEVCDLVAICTDWLTVQAQTIALCNAVHSADKRVARWILRVAEATRNDIIDTTQELMSEMLGLRRTTVTLIAQDLKEAGVIDYRRGVIRIRDPQALEAASCDCCRMLGRRYWPAETVETKWRHFEAKPAG